MMLDPAMISLGFALVFLGAQIFWAWTGVTLVHVSGVVFASVLTGSWATAILPAAALIAFVLSMGSALAWVENGLRRTARSRGQRLPDSSWKRKLAGPVTQIVYLAALISASFLRRVAWRGITYELFGATPVRLVAYRPYLSATVPTDRTASLV